MGPSMSGKAILPARAGSALQLGLSGVGGATTGKYIECTRAMEVFPNEGCKAWVTSMAANYGVAPLS